MQKETTKTKIIKRILAKVRPYINSHGGDVELVEIKDKTVILKISGACVGCPLANSTYNKIVRDAIKEKIPEVKKVVFKNT